MRPPAPSTSPAISPRPRRAVPLNSMCSWKWARPRSSSRSSAEPARAQIWNSATGAVSVSCRTTVSRFGSCSQKTLRWLTIRRSYRRHTLFAMDDLGVYLHVPFCERICPYCDFPVVAARSLGRATEERYVAALRTELAARRADFADRRLATIYLGGGTPSLLSPRSVRELIDAVRGSFAGEPAEVTLEVNPSTLERERLPGFRAAGVDRVSVGIQSFDDTTLRRLGRAHRAREGVRTLAACRAAGFARLSLDLIAAAPGQQLADFDRELAAALSEAPDHVSVYELTLEPGTPFARAAQRGRLALADEDTAARMLERAEQRLAEAGY